MSLDDDTPTINDEIIPSGTVSNLVRSKAVEAMTKLSQDELIALRAFFREEMKSDYEERFPMVVAHQKLTELVRYCVKYKKTFVTTIATIVICLGFAGVKITSPYISSLNEVIEFIENGGLVSE